LISSGLFRLWPQELPRLTHSSFVPVFCEPLSGASESRPLFTRKSQEDIMINGVSKNIDKSNLQNGNMPKMPNSGDSGYNHWRDFAFKMQRLELR
jgi:hypothetical protein